jgi:hypothetical protein
MKASDHPCVSYFEYEDGSMELSIEWFGPGERHLLVSTTGKLEFLKSWGPNMNTEMKDGDVENPDKFYALLKWVNEPKGKGP